MKKGTNTIVDLLVPNRIRNHNQVNAVDNDEESLLILEPADANETEREWINLVALHQPTPVANLFLRLVRYFNGHFHTEEIVFRESILRKDFKLILRFVLYGFFQAIPPM
jgi:hypothetical protein